MLSAILSFLGGGVFRAILGEVSAFLSRRQDHAQEMERMRLEAELAAQQHARNLESIRLQAELGVKTIQVQADADMGRDEVRGWAQAARDALRPTGVFFVDMWNGLIRPLCATIAVLLWVIALHAQGWVMTDWDRDLVGMILGFFFVSRIMQRTGK